MVSCALWFNILNRSTGEYSILDHRSEDSPEFARGQRILSERTRLNLTQPQMAKIGGVSKGSQILYEKGKAPTADYLAAIERAGADIVYILTGRSEADEVTRIMEAVGPVAALQTLLSEHGEEAAIRNIMSQYGGSGGIQRQSGFSEVKDGSDLGRVEALRGGYLPIPFARLSGSAHRGAAPVAFAKSWLDQERIEVEHLSMVYVSTDGLDPLIRLGALALISATPGRTPNHDPWCYELKSTPGFAMISRADDGSVVLAGYGGDARPHIIPQAEAGSLRLVGRIVWSGRPV